MITASAIAFLAIVGGISYLHDKVAGKTSEKRTGSGYAAAESKRLNNQNK